MDITIHSRTCFKKYYLIEAIDETEAIAKTEINIGLEP